MKMILTGCGCIDSNLGGGISPGTVTAVYGEPETGKTTLAIQCAMNCAMQNLKTLFVDCDNTFYAKRLSQLALGKFDEIAELIFLIKPKDFKEQTAVVDRLQDYTAKNFGLVVFDTFTSLYRAEVAEASGKAYGLNRELNRQLAIVAQTARIQRIPVILTSQVHSVFDNPMVSVAPVATRVLKFWSDAIIAMKPTENSQIIEAVLEKAPRMGTEAICPLRIQESGIHDYSLH
jgi:DNA repair protein RadB